MAGIYIHIPFCKTICHYCDFHKELFTNKPNPIQKAIEKEIELQKDYLEGEEIDTIYFGGGTPSVMSPKKIGSLYETIRKFHHINNDPEITLEANPDDLNIDYLHELNGNKVNRISIGVQSFFDEELKILNRRHSAGQSYNSIKQSIQAGFKNVGIDLIYGIPGTGIELWERSIEKALELPIQHISAYHLTIEPGTAFATFLKSGKIKLMEEERSVEQFGELINRLEENGFVHYEISNFCKEGFYSKHNTNYWKQKKYLGLGPSAHSFNGTSRQWNLADNNKYIDAIAKNKVPCSKETLDEKTRYNEYILTSLRTMWGADLKYIEETFSKEARDYCVSLSNRFIDYGMVEKNEENLILTQQGKLISDNIISELLMID
jgi:oxygen-independent coproporphyrinogen-3 oxidase